MPDLTDQLRGYHDSLAATVEPVTAAEAMTTAAPPSPESRDRRAKWQWRMVAAAAAVLVVLVGWVAFTGSSGPMRWLTGDDADALRGRTFNAVSMTEGGGAPEPAVGSLTFTGDFVDLYDGCNTMNASFSVERGRLMVGPGMSTGMDCGQDGTGPERWARVLSSAGVALDGDRLTLSDDTITVELVDKYAPPTPGTVVAVAHTPTLAELEGRSFRSTSVREDGVERVLVADPTESDGSPAHLSFEVHNGVLLLRAGCNAMSATPTIVDGRIQLGLDALATEKGCDEALMAQDSWYFALISSSPTISIDATTLTVTSGTTVIVFDEEPVAVPTTQATAPLPNEGATGGASILTLGSYGAEYGSVEELVGQSDLVVVARPGAVRNLGGSSVGSDTSERALFSQRIDLTDVLVARPGMAIVEGDEVTVVWTTANDLDPTITDRYANGSMDLGGLGTGVLPSGPVLLFLAADTTSQVFYPSLDGPTFRIVGEWQGARVVLSDGRLDRVDFFASDPPNLAIPGAARTRLRELASERSQPDIIGLDGATLQAVEDLAPGVPRSELPPGGEG